MLLGLMIVLKSSVSSLTPTQTTPRVQQHNPRKIKKSYKTVNSQRAFLQDNNKPAPTRITLHTTHRIQRTVIITSHSEGKSPKCTALLTDSPVVTNTRLLPQRLRQTDWNVPFVVRRQQGGESWKFEGEEREVLVGSSLHTTGE